MPCTAQCGGSLVAGEDLLGDDVERAIRRQPIGRAFESQRPRREVLQHREVARRVEQAVGVVDADRVTLPSRISDREQLVRRLEDLRVLDAQAGERVDVEEAPVVDLVRRRAPVREAVGLRLEQLVEPVEARGWPGVPLSRWTASSIARAIAGTSCTSRASRARATSFSRWRSTARDESSSVYGGRFWSAVMML